MFICLVAEWQSAAEQLYDPKPLLAAEQHASASALADRQRDGGKSVGLADCLEVGRVVGVEHGRCLFVWQAAVCRTLGGVLWKACVALCSPDPTASPIGPSAWCTALLRRRRSCSRSRCTPAGLRSRAMPNTTGRCVSPHPVQTFLQPEQLDEDDCWFCSKCKKHVQVRV